jgi:hypothetical protein
MRKRKNPGEIVDLELRNVDIRELNVKRRDLNLVGLFQGGFFDGIRIDLFNNTLLESDLFEPRGNNLSSRILTVDHDCELNTRTIREEMSRCINRSHSELINCTDCHVFEEIGVVINA